MTIAFVEAAARGAGVAGGTATYPAVSAGDGLLLLVYSRGSADPTVTNPSGWGTPIGTYNGGAGAYGAGLGNARVTSYWKESDGTETGTFSVTVTGGGSVSVLILRYSKTAGAWEAPVIDGGTDVTQGTGWSVTGAGLAVAAGDMIVVPSCANGNGVTASSHALSSSGITFDTVNERADVFDGTGDDHYLFTVDALVSAGSGSAAPTYTATLATSGTNTICGATAFIRLREASGASILRQMMAHH